MANVRVSVVHDLSGEIVAVARAAEGANAIALSGDGQAVSEIDVDEQEVAELVGGRYAFDMVRRSLVTDVRRDDRGSEA